MRLPCSSQREPVGFNMTPMIDVVFLLIIFFLVSSHLARQDTQVKLPLPVADSGQQDQTDARRIVVHLQPDGQMSSGGQTLVADELDRFLAERRAATDDGIELRIRGHREVPYRHVKPILLAAARSGVWNVQFAVVHSRDAR